MLNMSETELSLLRDIFEHFDGIADGAPDASYPAKMALQFSEPLKRLVDRLEPQTVASQLGNAWNASDREFDETVGRLRDEGRL